MDESRKEKIIANLQQAKETGQLKTERIREIIKNAISETVLEAKTGRTEINILVQEAIAAVTELYQDKKGEIKEEVTATIEGAIDGISNARREIINDAQSEIQTLEVKVEKEEAELQSEIDGVLSELETNTTKEKSAQVSAAVTEAINTVRNSEEAALLQKRYAQLKAQLAIVQANLANRYGENYTDTSKYLDDAKAWYEKAKANPEVFTDKVETKQQEFEEKMGEAGSAIAKREKQAKQLLKELWHAISEVFRDRH